MYVRTNVGMYECIYAFACTCVRAFVYISACTRACACVFWVWGQGKGVIQVSFRLSVLKRIFFNLTKTRHDSNNIIIFKCLSL